MVNRAGCSASSNDRTSSIYHYLSLHSEYIQIHVLFLFVYVFRIRIFYLQQCAELLVLPGNCQMSDSEKVNYSRMSE